MKKFILSFLWILALHSLQAAGTETPPPTVIHTVLNQPLTWNRVVNTLNIDSHWYVYLEADNRIFLSPVKESQFICRAVGRYIVNNSMDVGLSFVYAANFPGNPVTSNLLLTPELRGCADIIFYQRFGKILTFIHRSVFENRAIHNASSTELEAGYHYAFRYRYRLHADILAWTQKNQSFKFVVSDEMMLQAGKGIVNNIFDQNRAYAAINYAPLKYINFEAGYMWLYQEANNGTLFYNRSIFRFTVFTQIYVPKKVKAPTKNF